MNRLAIDSDEPRSASTSRACTIWCVVEFGSAMISLTFLITASGVACVTTSTPLHREPDSVPPRVGSQVVVMWTGHDASRNGAAEERGVQRVVAQAAEDLLADGDREDRPHDRHPPRNSGRDVERQQDAGDERASVADGDRHASHLLNGRLGDERRETRQQRQKERPQPVEVDGAYDGRHQRDDDAVHHPLNGDVLAHVRRRGDEQVLRTSVPSSQLSVAAAFFRAQPAGTSRT